MLLTKNKRLRQIVGVLETGNFLFLKLLWKARDRANVYPGEVYRTYMGLVREDRWRCVSIFDALPKPERCRVTVEHIPSEVIETRLEQLACLAIFTRVTAPKAILEIGTFRGRTALNFALNAPDDCKVYTMDLPPDDRKEAADDCAPGDRVIIEESRTGCEYRGTDVEHKIEQLYGDSQSYDFSGFRNRVDIVYVDGAHHYSAARKDTENALEMVRPGGYVLWDEFCNYGDYNDVTRAVLDVVPAEHVMQIENTQLAVYRAPQE